MYRIESIVYGSQPVADLAFGWTIGVAPLPCRRAQARLDPCTPLPGTRRSRFQLEGARLARRPCQAVARESGLRVRVSIHAAQVRGPFGLILTDGCLSSGR